MYEKVFEGEPVLTLQADRSDVTFALESYGSGDYWERGIYLDEHPMESFDMTVTWTITWGEVTQTGSFQVCARIPENGIPEGISIMPSGTITAKAGEPFTMTVSMIPEGWTMDGVEPVIYIDGEADSVETNGLAATVMYNEPGWYVLDVQAGAKSYFFWQDVLIKVTDAKGNVPEAPDMVLNIDMADSYVVGEVVPLSSQLMNNVGWSNWIDTLTKDGQPYAYEGVWDSDLEVDGFVATETGTYTYSISVEDLLGRKISESHTFMVVEGTPLTFGGVSVATGDGSLDISVRLSGGMSTPSTRVDLYRGLSNNVRVGTVTGKGTSYLFDQLIDGLYQAVVHTTDGTSSFAQATGFYEVKNGKVTALTGTLTLPKALREIDEEAFYGTAAATVIVPSGTTTIGAHAFQNSYVTRITIPASVTSIADNAFEGASRYITVVTPAGSKAETWAKNHGYLVEN